MIDTIKATTEQFLGRMSKEGLKYPLLIMF